MNKEVLSENASKVKKIAEEFQDDCHRCVAEIMKDNDHISYQDATNVWVFTKLAELKHQINYLIYNQTQKR